MEQHPLRICAAQPDRGLLRQFSLFEACKGQHMVGTSASWNRGRLPKEPGEASALLAQEGAVGNYAIVCGEESLVEVVNVTVKERNRCELGELKATCAPLEECTDASSHLGKNRMLTCDQDAVDVPDGWLILQTQL